MSDPVERRSSSPVQVTVQMGFNRNMGNFESMKINVGLTAPARQGENAAQAFDRVYEFVEARLVEKFQETEEALRKQGLGQED